VTSDFLALRARWEYGHALDWALFAAAFILLGARCSCVKPPERRRRAAIHHQKGLSNGDFQDRLSLPTAPKE
jgi:hypothetical protein